jgi:uncharacterized protein YkwD
LGSRTFLFALVFCALAFPASALADCPDADLIPTAQNLGDVRDALLCLHNEERRQRGLPALKDNPRLKRAAVAHTEDMLENGYFGHGSSFAKRILKAGYAETGDDWELGENLAWGAGELATPQAVMDAWMDSPGQRSTILSRDFRQLGIGIRLGLPNDPTVGVTITADFGVVD